MALAQFEREMTSVRVRENALTRLLNDGKINGDAELLGLDRDPNRPGHFIPNSEELKQVERLMHLFLQVPGKAKLLKEAKRLAIKNKKDEDLQMHGLTIILENARWRYRGLWPANRDNKEKDPGSLPENKRYTEVKLPHGPLLDIDLLDKVAYKIGASRTNIKSGSDSYTYMLSGILKDEQGNSFTGQHGKGGTYRYYYNRISKQRLHCEDVDKVVCSAIKEHILSEEKFRELIKKGYQEFRKKLPDFDHRISELQELEAKIKQDEKTIRRSFSAEKLDDPVYSGWLKEQVTEIVEKIKKNWI